MIKKLFYICLCSIVFLSTATGFAHPPKLIIFVVLDQFPYDYFQRFQPYFSTNGFNYIIHHGANFTNAHYEHAYMKTASGHAALTTGTYGHRNGIIANRWYDRPRNIGINSVDDETVHTLGNNHQGFSPRNLMTNTFGDILRSHSNLQSKVFGLSNKDRAAILMAGKLGTAYWFEDSLIVSSTYYMQELPYYIQAFNSSGIFQKYFGKEWVETNPAIAVTICDDDDVPYEANWHGLGRSFPHKITGDNTSTLTPSYYFALNLAPYTTELLFAVTEKMVVAESLGTRNATDMLCLGVSATDEIGHAFGPNSHEVFDNVLRTDAMLAKLLNFLDLRIGLENCLIVLTSDHGVAPIPEYLKKKNRNIHGGRVSSLEILRLAERTLENKFGNNQSKKWVAQVIESDIYLNREWLKEKGVSLESAMSVLKDTLSSFPPIAAVFTGNEIENGNIHDSLEKKMEKSFHPARSGDVMFILKPYFIMSSDTVGTNHGQPYEYDSHIPLIFVGKNFKQGTYSTVASPVDIAPTLSTIFGLKSDTKWDGRILKKALKIN